MLTKNFIDRLIALGDRIDRQEIHRTLRTVAEERDFLRIIFNSMREGVVVLTRSGKVTFLNRAAKHLLALRAEDDQFARLEDCVFDLNLLDMIRSAHDQGDRIIDREVITRHRVERHLNVNVIPLVEGDGGSPGSVVLLLDVTARKEDDDRLRRAEHLASLTTVFAGLAHEIRNPLNSLGIHLQLAERSLKSLALEDTSGDGARIQHHLEIVGGEVERLNQVVERFLHAVKEKPLQLRHCGISEILGSTIEMLRPEFEAENIRVEFRQESEDDALMADPEDLRLAFVNLFKNAIEAMPGGGDIVLTVRSDHDTVRIHINDTGVGIRESDLSRIFDPYFTTRAEGTGLGLMIVNRVVKEHGGRIEVKSRLGIGTEFILTFPLYRGGPKLIKMAEPAAPVAEAAASTPQTGTND